MAKIQDARPGSVVTAVVDPTYNALHTSVFPVEQEGAFRLARRSGTIAGSTIAGIQYSFRYLGAGTCVILSVKLGLQITTAYTQGSISYTMFPVRGFRNSDTGGTTATIGNIQKLRSTMPESQSELIIANTGVLTSQGGIETSQPIASIQHDLPASLQAMPMREFLNYGPYSKPLTLIQFEGFRIRNTPYAATGTSVLVVAVEWIEKPPSASTFY
jgi:hypothetical protein